MGEYSPELIEDFEKAVAETEALLSLHKHSKEKIYTSTRTRDALQVFAHNWQRVRDLKEAGRKLAESALDSDAAGVPEASLADMAEAFKGLLEKGNE